MKRFAVIGLGKFGSNVAKALFEDNNEVVAIDNDKVRVQSVDRFSTEAIVLDATDKDALKALGLDSMDGLILAISSNISNSVLICIHLHEIGVENILAKAEDDDHAKILSRVGATKIVHPERDIAKRISLGLSRPNVIDFIPLSKDFDLVQIEPPHGFVGENLKSLNLPAKYNVHIIAIKEITSDDFILVPRADFIIKESDILTILGKSEDIGQIKALK
jgi:trk system potassium uptake protein TrkA